MSRNFIMTSLDLAQLTGKLHKSVLRDIRDEASKIGNERAGNIFVPGSYLDENNQARPMIYLTQKGTVQIAARYDANVRYDIISKVEELQNVVDSSQTSNVLDELSGLKDENSSLRKNIEELKEELDYTKADLISAESSLQKYRDDDIENGYQNNFDYINENYK